MPVLIVTNAQHQGPWQVKNEYKSNGHFETQG